MLTREQTELLEQYRTRWEAARLSIAPVDRLAAEEGVNLAYRAAGLVPPQRIEWCDGPVDMVRRWEVQLRSASIGANVRARVFDRRRNQVSKAVREQLTAGARSLVLSAVRPTQADIVGTAVLQAVTQSIVGSRRQRWFHIRQAVASFVGLSRSPNQRSDFGWSSCGQHQLGWLASFEYLRDACGLRHQTEALRGLWLIAANAGWILPHEQVCWLAERHNVLCFDAAGRLHCATGPALAYPDGWSFYAWKGIEVPGALIEKPDTITLERIDQELDIIVRRCMIEIITPKRFIRMGGASRASQDETGILWKKSWWNGDAWAAVQVVDGTPAADGTRQSYFLQVPFGLSTARAAVAWTYGMSEHQYSRLVQRT
jgi:hypothetical protein